MARASIYCLAVAPSVSGLAPLARRLARIGDASQARALADELRRDYPNNSLVKLYWLPTINAAIQLQANNSAAALMELETAAPYELGDPPPMVTGTLYPRT